MYLKLKNESRAFELKQFRNIGYGDNSKENSTLTLNYSLNPDYMGDLVILIGPNNSGKSNVLDALSCFAKRNILKRDYSDTRLNDENPNLKLFASYKQNKTNETIYEYELNKDNKLQFKEGTKIENEPLFDLDEYTDIFRNSNHENFSDDLMIIEDLLKKYNFKIYQPIFEYGKNSYVNFNETKLNHKEIKNNLIELEKLMRSIIANSKINLLELADFYDEIKKDCGSYINAFLEECNKYIKLTDNDKWLSKKCPKIIKYDEVNITSEDLKCNIKEIDNNIFFQKLINISRIEKKELLKIYKKYEENHSTSVFYKSMDDYNKKFEWIQTLFNDLYCTEKENKYIFELHCEATHLVFVIFKYNEQTNEKTPLNLNYQSTGFKWFFNFFFNIYASNEFKTGDIIMMDEPATNLHVKGQEELHDFLKKFAIQSGITFVIATHSPFLVKLDCLDEVRLIIPQSDNTSYINNNFTTVNPDDADSLLPIRESLTVRNSILLDPNQIVIFVEGITDYNYFVAMQKLIKSFDNLTFLPINGLGKMKQMKEKIDELHKIKTWNSLVLTDGDWAGEKFYKINEDDPNPLRIVKLTDINPKFTEIENLFSNQDQERFNLKNVDVNANNNRWNKNISLSVTLKKIIQKEIWRQEDNKDYKIDVVDNETISNFKQVFEYLTNKITDINANNKSVKNIK